MKQYSGDGTISDTSQSSGLFGTNGYILDFPGFDLGAAHQVTYHLAGLPSLGRANAEIALMIKDPKGFSATDVDELRHRTTATFKCSLVDSSGKVVTTFETPLKNLIWSGPIHDRSGYALYDLDKSFFAPRSDANYTLSIEYSGDSSLAGEQGAVYIWCGCGGS